MKDENKSGKFRLWDLVPVWAIVLFAVFIAAFAALKTRRKKWAV